MRINSVRQCAILAVSMLVLSGVGLFPAILSAADEFPANWKELSPEDLVIAAYPFYNPDTQRLEGNIDGEAVRKQCEALIANVDFTTSPLSYKILDGLHWAAFPYLTDSERTRIKNQILARQDDWAGKPFAEVQYKNIILERMGFSQEETMREGRRWVQAGGRREDVPADKLSGDARYFFTAEESRRIYGSFQVKWTGFLVAPATGNYVFSLGNINSSSAHPERPVDIQGALTIRGAKVLEPTSSNWIRESVPVQLVGDELTPFELQMEYRAPDSASCSFHGRLLWSGPNIEQQVVPFDALRHPDGDVKGVVGRYTWIQDGQEQNVERYEPGIDYTWALPVIWLSTEPFVDRDAAIGLWREVTSAVFLNSLQDPSGKVTLHPYLQSPDESAGTMSASRQKQFLSSLLQRPALLDPVDSRQATLLYGAFRFGAPDEALQVLGLWAQRHPDSECLLPNEERFEAINRSRFWRTSVQVAHDYPEHLEQLQADYLKLSDGRCSLPVAYILGYAYQELGRIEEWIEILAQERENPAISGDKKVNWLLARAFAEEIRQGAPGFDSPTIPRVTDGMVWIDEARIVAESPESHRRLIKEWAGRLMATEQFDAAQSVLEQNAGLVSEADQGFLAEWKAWNETLRQRASGSAARQAAVAKQAYIDQLKTRLAQASASGDTDAASRYQSLISAAEQVQ